MYNVLNIVLIKSAKKQIKIIFNTMIKKKQD